MVYNYLRLQLGEVAFNLENVCIEVKSKQNYKSEWEKAEFRATLELLK